MGNESIQINATRIEEDIAVPCLLCGVFLSLNEREHNLLLVGHVPVKVCKECRAAVAFAKKQMKNPG